MVISPQPHGFIPLLIKTIGCGGMGQLVMFGLRSLWRVTTFELWGRCWTSYASSEDAHASRLSAHSILNPFSMKTLIEMRFCSTLPLIPSTVAHGCARGALERRWPGHSGLFKPGPVTRVHGIRALYLSVVMPVGVRITAMFDFDGGPRLSPKMLRRLKGRLSLPGNRQRKRETLFRARWRFHHSANE